MKKILSVVFSVVLLLAVRVTAADEFSLVAAYSCDSERHRFAVMADVDSDDPEVKPYRYSDERYIKRLPTGQHTLKCEWAGAKVVADVLVWDPNQRMCEGGGGAMLRKLEINGKEYQLSETDFHPLNCFSDVAGALTKFTVREVGKG